jgi:ABC-type glycerol-3-phosphate transport system permease component
MVGAGAAACAFARFLASSHRLDGLHLVQDRPCRLRRARATFTSDLDARRLSRRNWGREFVVYFANSLFVNISASLFTVALATLAGYSFARMRLRGRQALMLAHWRGLHFGGHVPTFVRRAAKRKTLFIMLHQQEVRTRLGLRVGR